MRILLATDLSKGSETAIREGLSIASPADSLAIVRVVSVQELRPGQDLKRASDLVREQVSRISDRAIETTFVDEGVDYAAIVRRAEAWQADLIVVGSHGQAGLWRAFGHVVERVVRYAHCDVLVARGQVGDGPVVAATDLSDLSLPAIVEGAEQARRRRASLEVVHAVGFLEIEATHVLAPPESISSVDDYQVAADSLRETVRRLGVEAQCKVLDGPAAAAIVAEAEATHAALVVVGTHGRTGLLRAMLGSVAEKVLHAAPCSVLTVKPRARSLRS
jgi:nucleotide-binding universal stress UspA family protein